MGAALTGSATASQMTQALQRLGQLNQSSQEKSIQQLKKVDAKTSQAARQVVDHAIEIKSKTVQAKSKMLDVMA